MRKRRLSLFVALLAMFAIVAAACGDDKTSTSTTTVSAADACPKKTSKSAAWTVIGNVLLNLDEILMKR